MPDEEQAAAPTFDDLIRANTEYAASFALSGLAPRADDAGRNADGNRAGRDIFTHDGPGADYGAVTHHDTVEDLRARANPGAVADRHTR